MTRKLGYRKTSRLDLIAGSPFSYHLYFFPYIWNKPHVFLLTQISLRSQYSAWYLSDRLRNGFPAEQKTPPLYRDEVFPRFHSNKRIFSFTQSACNVCQTSPATVSRRRLPDALHISSSPGKAYSRRLSLSVSGRSATLPVLRLSLNTSLSYATFPDLSTSLFPGPNLLCQRKGCFPVCWNLCRSRK